MTHDDGYPTHGENADPLLVRPYLVGERSTADMASAHTWPATAPDTKHAIKSHRAGPIAVPGAPSESGEPRRRRGLVLAGAGAAAVIALAASGYAAFRPAGDGDDFPVPSGALPLPPASSTPAQPGPQTTPHAVSTTRAGTAPTAATATATTRTTAPGAPRQGSVPVPPAPGATATAAPSSPAESGAAPTEPALSEAPSVARVGAIAGDGNLCLDLNGGVPADDNHVQVFDCNGTVAQQWTLATDGTLQVVGKCAQVTGDATVHIIGCDSRETAQWRAGPDETLVNVATDQCLTDPQAGTRSGAGVKVTECESTGNQQWALPG